MTGSARPLAGLRVLDFTQFVAGPYAARLLADMGADVVKVEPPEGDTLRHAAPQVAGESAFFAGLNLGKRGVMLDLKSDEGRDRAIALAVAADVVLENFRPGVMSRLGLGPDVLRAANPRLIFCSISGYGQDGPDAARPAFAPIINAASGYAMGEFRYQRGRDKPERSRTVAADILGGTHAVIAILAALQRRHATGHGDCVDVELLAGLMNMMPFELQEAQFPDPVLRVPVFDPIRCADGFIVVAPVTKKNFEAMATACDRRDWLDDPRFATPLARMSHWSELIAEVEAWAADRPAQDAAREIEHAGCPCRRFLTPAEAINRPELAARGTVLEIDDIVGRHKVVNTPFRFTDGEVGVAGPAPRLGADTDAVLLEWLAGGS
ncbi:MAG: CoA transferase [Pseudomonadota bacterium]|nr:CoA transferase [Pseudomonadota bacterium]